MNDRKIERVTRSSPEIIHQHIGWRIYQRRISIGLTQLQVAKGLGVSFQQVHKYENALARLSAARLWQLRDILDVDLDYFFEGLESPVTRAVNDDAPVSRSEAFGTVLQT